MALYLVVRVLFLAVDKHGCAVKVPDNVIIEASIEGKNADIGFAPVNSVIPLSIAGQIAPIIVHKRSPVLVFRYPIAGVWFLIGARHMQDGNLIDPTP